MPLASSFKHGERAALDERHHATEPRGTLFERKALEFPEHPAPVGGRIFVLAGITSRMDPRSTAERIDLKPRVVGEAVALEEIPDGTGLFDGIAAQRVVGFGKVAGKTQGSGRDDREGGSQDGPGFFQFMGIVGGKDKFHGKDFRKTKDTDKIAIFACNMLIEMKRMMIRAAVAVMVLLGAATFETKAQSRDFKLGQSLELEYAVLKELAQSYVDTVDFDKMILSGVRAMLATLDPYTVYISEEEGEDFELLTTGNYGGVGSLIRKKVGEGVRIIEPYEGSPAAKAGLQPGDEILEIDDIPVYDETSEQSSGRMKGQPGTEVKFKVVKGRTKDTVDVVVVRERIHVSDIAYSGIYRDDIGYISLTGFTAKISEEFKEHVLRLKEAGAKKLIIDLRDNGGGVMDEAINIVSLFVPKGTLVVSSKGRVPEMNREYRTTAEPIDTLMPLLVMVNGNSASASEITAGALQDLKRATIAGTRSFGKGLIQSIRPMPYNSQMKLTTGKYYTPSGRCVQAIDYSNRHEDGTLDKDPGGGIAPDIEAANHPYSRPTASLVYYDIIGSYAIDYFLKHETIDRDFHLTDAEYEDFVIYASSQDFDARTAAQTALDRMIEAAKAEDMYDTFKTEIEALQKKVNMDKGEIVRAKKAEILPLLEQEIVTCYYFNRASVPVGLRYDEQLREAVDKWTLFE